MDEPTTLPRRVLASLAGRTRSLRAHPALNPRGRAELRAGRGGGHPVDEAHEPHLREAVAWIARAQDATPDDGISRGYCLAYNPHFRTAGWQPSYPETTGYLIPTLFSAARALDDPRLARRAARAAAWEIRVQLPDGAVQGGVIGEGRSPAVFNTGQVIFGWLDALRETARPEMGAAARRAGDYLVSVMEEDGHWRKGNSRYARPDATLYNARTAWALAEAGARLDVPAFLAAAERNLRAVAAEQHDDGWFPHCCLNRPDRPLLHTVAYAIRGLVEGGRVLDAPELVEAGARAARRLSETVRPDGWMPGRYEPGWSAGSDWSCLTGQAQMANNWIRLAEITGDLRWLEPVPAVLRFLKSTQNRTTRDPGLRGGIKGSQPVDGEYGRYEVLNWATKYFADALMRSLALARGGPTSDLVSTLA